MPAKFLSLVGMTFGFVEAVEHKGFNERRQALYRIKCRCGDDTKIVRGADLTGGLVRRCCRACPYRPDRLPIFRREISQRGDEVRFQK